MTDPMTGENRAPDERFLRSVEEKIKVSESGKQSFRQEVVRKAMVAFKAGEKFRLGSHARVREAIEQYLFEERRDVLRLVTSTNRPDSWMRVATLPRSWAGGGSTSRAWKSTCLARNSDSSRLPQNLKHDPEHSGSPARPRHAFSGGEPAQAAASRGSGPARPERAAVR